MAEPGENGGKPGRNGSLIDRATTYVSLGLTLTLVVLAFHFGSKLAQLEKVPTRDEVQLIVRDAVTPLQKELWELKTEIQLIKAQSKGPGTP